MPKSGIHGHDQHLIEVLHDLFENSCGSCWINGDADALSHAFDALHGARQVVVSLPVHQKRVRSGLRKFVDEKIGIENHQVRFQRQARHSSQRLDNHRAQRKVRHEMSVHHVNVDSVRSRTLGLGHLIA